MARKVLRKYLGKCSISISDISSSAGAVRIPWKLCPHGSWCWTCFLLCVRTSVGQQSIFYAGVPLPLFHLTFWFSPDATVISDGSSKILKPWMLVCHGNTTFWEPVQPINYRNVDLSLTYFSSFKHFLLFYSRDTSVSVPPDTCFGGFQSGHTTPCLYFVKYSSIWKSVWSLKENSGWETNYTSAVWDVCGHVEEFTATFPSFYALDCWNWCYFNRSNQNTCAFLNFRFCCVLKKWAIQSLNSQETQTVLA